MIAILTNTAYAVMWLVIVYLDAASGHPILAVFSALLVASFTLCATVKAVELWR